MGAKPLHIPLANPTTCKGNIALLGGYFHLCMAEMVILMLQIHSYVVYSVGFIKATETDKPENISVESMGNKVAQKGVDAIRKKLLNPLKILKGMKN